MITLLNIYLKSQKLCFHNKLCTDIFEYLLKFSKTWKYTYVPVIPEYNKTALTYLEQGCDFKPHC